MRVLLLAVAAALPARVAAEGVSVRGFAGLTHVRTWNDGYTTDADGIGFGLRMAFSVFNDLDLIFEFIENVGFNPDSHFPGHYPDLPVDPVDHGRSYNYGVGVGLSYTFLPANIDVSATLMAANSTASYQDWKASAPAFNVMANKSWTLSDDWSLGVAAQIFLASFADAKKGCLCGSTNLFGGVFFTATHELVP